MPARYRQSILVIAALVAIALACVHHLSTPNATASQSLAASMALADPPAPAGIALAAAEANTTGETPVPHWRAMPVIERASALSLARRDPWALASLGRQFYEEEIDDYTCVFLKQERIDGGLRDVEEIEVRYREEPTTVYMIWKRNADQAKRVLFIDTPQFVNGKGEKVARVEPAGALIRLIISDILMPIHGERARQTSRRFIDQFGLRSTFDLFDRYNELGAKHGVLDLRFAGEGEIDGRPTYVIERHLPYDGPDGIWPDAKMVMHLDQKWLLPTAVYSYADSAGQVLLGSYVTTKLRLNPGLSDEAFEF